MAIRSILTLQRVCKGRGLTHACKLGAENPLVMWLFYILQDFCVVALSTLLSENRNKLFEHRRHLPLECSPAVSPECQSHHPVSSLRFSDSAPKLLASLISTKYQSVGQEQTHCMLQLYKKTQQNTCHNQALFHSLIYACVRPCPLHTLYQKSMHEKILWRSKFQNSHLSLKLL